MGVIARCCPKVWLYFWASNKSWHQPSSNVWDSPLSFAQAEIEYGSEGINKHMRFRSAWFWSIRIMLPYARIISAEPLWFHFKISLGLKSGSSVEAFGLKWFPHVLDSTWKTALSFVLWMDDVLMGLVWNRVSLIQLSLKWCFTTAIRCSSKVRPATLGQLAVFMMWSQSANPSFALKLTKSPSRKMQFFSLAEDHRCVHRVIENCRPKWSFVDAGDAMIASFLTINDWAAEEKVQAWLTGSSFLVVFSECFAAFSFMKFSRPLSRPEVRSRMFQSVFGSWRLGSALNFVGGIQGFFQRSQQIENIRILWKGEEDSSLGTSSSSTGTFCRSFETISATPPPFLSFRSLRTTKWWFSTNRVF